MSDDATVQQEFDAAVQRAGLDVPPERRAGLLAMYVDMKKMTALVRGPRTAAAEPSNIYTLIPFLNRG